MKSSNIIPQEMKGYYTNDKTDVFPDHYFQWKVRLTYIPSRKNKFKFSLPAL